MNLIFIAILIVLNACSPALSGSNRGSTALHRATFAGGCFWCMEPPFDKLKGVISTTSGYSGGFTKNPSYADVSAGITGHAEVVQVVYNPKLISYRQLLAVFWKNIDPTVENRQFCDRGSQYRSAIFFHNEEQEKQARQSLQNISKKFPNIFTEVVAFQKFYPAESYHQDYYQKNPIRYKYYRYRCGRDARLQQIWEQ